ncbi:MAG TPA: hypothetical protein VEB86_17410 [Chryseosolibacter sp.]|nr:hypothetical protein [Chryseosolibacter sp.]
MFTPIASGQTDIKEIKPAGIEPLNLSSDEAARFEKTLQMAIAIFDKMKNGTKFDDLSQEEQKIVQQVDEKENYWDVLGNGCSWYCGGGPEGVTASSELKPQGTNSYEGSKAHDLSYQTAWVEGAAGYGTGEFLTYKFSAASPRITDIIVVNGYVKSEKSYLENSRVKKLKMYLNETPIAILHLADIRSNQTFRFGPIGHGERENFESLKLRQDWTLKFEILEVYEGSKYDDVAITEIYFDGVDVH